MITFVNTTLPLLATSTCGFTVSSQLYCPLSPTITDKRSCTTTVTSLRQLPQVPHRQSYRPRYSYRSSILNKIDRCPALPFPAHPYKTQYNTPIVQLPRATNFDTQEQSLALRQFRVSCRLPKSKLPLILHHYSPRPTPIVIINEIDSRPALPFPILKNNSRPALTFSIRRPLYHF